MHGAGIKITNRVVQIFQKSMSRHKRLGARRVTQSKYHRGDSQKPGATVPNLVLRVTWRPEFFHPCKWICLTGSLCNRNVICTNCARNALARI